MKNKTIEDKILSAEQIKVLKTTVVLEFKEAFTNQGLSSELFDKQFLKMTSKVADEIATKTQMSLLQQATFEKIVGNEKTSKKITKKKPGPKKGSKKKIVKKSKK